MYNELTENDIKKMKEEIEYRIKVVRPKIIKEIQESRAMGDLSENAEYHAARREKGKNEGRIEYLKNMIDTAKIISLNDNKDEVGIFDKVEILFEDENEVEKVQISTTLRNDVSKGIISKESPFGKAILGRKVGERVKVNVSKDVGYFVKILSIEKSGDDIDLPIMWKCLTKSKKNMIMTKQKKERIYGK